MSQGAPVRAIVQWHAWNAEAFARASREARPVLLSLTTSWSRGGREMDRTTYADAAIASEINARFIAIRVDADERPDVAERYELGGIPTTAFLSPSGQLLGGGTFVDADRLRQVLGRVSASMAAVDLPVDVPPSIESDDVGRDEADIERAVFDTFDEHHAGFGTSPKFPFAAPVHLALVLSAERRDAHLLERATRTLDVMGWSGLFDAETGGFFRCCAAADWTRPQPDLLLDVNASLLHVYLDAAERTLAERYFARARDITRFLETKLRRHDGAWRIAAGVDASRVFTDANANAASALLHASRVLGETAIGVHALEALEHVLLASYKPGQGVAHHAAGVRGLLADHVAMMLATLEAWDESGNLVYRMMAEELAHFALRTMWDEQSGGFFDRAPSLFEDEPRAPVLPKPFILNCRAALALARLARAAEVPLFAAKARDTLEAIASSAHAHGPDAAHFLLARRAVLR